MGNEATCKICHAPLTDSMNTFICEDCSCEICEKCAVFSGVTRCLRCQEEADNE